MAKMNFLDRAVAAVSPVQGLKRATARRALEVTNSGYGNYGANLTKKSLIGWLFRGGSAKEDIEDNIDTLRQRSRDAYMGIPTASAALKTLCTNVVAGGLIPSPQIDAEVLGLTREQAEELQRKIMREFALWADTTDCDADGLGNFYKLQQLAYMGFLMNGDSFALLPFKERPGSQYATKVQIIEADRICSPDGYDRLVPDYVRGYHVHSIVQGVETNEDGMVVAYWICNRHPHSSLAVQSGTLEWTRVEAYGAAGRHNVLHVMTRERAGQLRGVPILAPVLETLKQLGRYTQAEIDAAVISAYFTVLVKPASVQTGLPVGQYIPKEAQVDSADPGSIEMGQGTILSLNPGDDVAFADPTHPNTAYNAFFDAMVKEIGAGMEIPPEVLEKQFTQNFSAARGALNEFWRVCDVKRDEFVDSFCQPIYEQFLAEAVARGRVHAPGFFTDQARRKAYCACVWPGPARTSLNPVQEVSAAIQRVEAGFSTAQRETAEMTGGDYMRNMEQRMMEAEKMRKLREILNPAPPPTPTPTPEPQTGDGEGEEDKTTEGGTGSA
jgi:lambda family phage portal protein